MGSPSPPLARLIALPTATAIGAAATDVRAFRSRKIDARVTAARIAWRARRLHHRRISSTGD
jgi:hypothetical protein